MMKKVGILGGSFDPIHNGHLAIAQCAYKEFSLDEIWLIPAGHSPNKNEKNMTAAKLRLQMTKLAAEEYSDFFVSDFEVNSEETSYTYRTLEYFKRNYPEIQFFFIMGADSLDYLEQWANPEIICQCAVILVAVRDDFDLQKIQKKISEIQKSFSADIQILHEEKLDISSSDIREKLARCEDVSKDIPKPVLQFIEEHNLYRNNLSV